MYQTYYSSQRKKSHPTKIIEQTGARTKSFENSFFPYCNKEWLKLIDEMRNIESLKQFKKTIIDLSGFKLLKRLRLNFSHLKKHKFRHICKDTINPMCRCGF